MKTIVSPSEGVQAGAEVAESRRAMVVTAMPGNDTSIASPRPVKRSAAELEQEFVITVETIHARAEAVTTVLESILHSQPVVPFTLR